MTRERARTERRDLDKERGEPVAGPARRPPVAQAHGPAARRLDEPAADPRHQRRRHREPRHPRAQARARPDRRRDGRRAGHEPVRGRAPEDADAPAARPGADARRRVVGLLGRRLPHRLREPRVPRLLRGALRPRRVGHQLRRQPRRRHHVLGDRVRGDGGGDQQLPGVRGQPGVRRGRRLRAGGRGVRDRRPQHPRARPQARRARVASTCPAVSVEDCEGIEVTRVGRRVYQDELTERIDPRGHPLLLDRRPAAVRDQRARARTSTRSSTGACP